MDDKKMIKEVIHNGKLFAMVIYQNITVDKVKFFSRKESNLQIGIIRKQCDDVIKPHRHLINERIVHTTEEVLYVISGSVEVDLYDGNSLFTTIKINKGDLIHLIAGGHGFKFCDDTVLYEIKQGPYINQDHDKEFFK